MSTTNKGVYQQVEGIIGIFTIDKGKLKVLLMRKKTEPYKGYWILPGNLLQGDETLEDSITDTVYDKMGLPSLYMEQCYTFSGLERAPEERVISVSFIGLIDITTVSLKKEVREDVENEWFSLDSIPKLGYNHEAILAKMINYLRKKIVNTNILKSLFPSDFTLPEIQKVYEQILNKPLDRRNFRKKFINLGLIEDTGYKNEGANGRPAKLYQFKENIQERELF